MTVTTQKPQPPRLPITDVPSRGAEVAKGVAALVGTVIVVVGVPIALLAAFGPPWPSEVPTMDWLTRPTTGEGVFAVLAVVVWVAWAHFVLCLIVEAIAEKRRRGLAPQVPGGGIGTQALARRVIATIVLLAGTASVTVGTASAATATVSATAQSSLSTSVLPEIVEASPIGQAGADQGLPTMDELESASTVDVQSGLTTFYDVKPPNNRHYDTLWDIADRYLGDGLRYKEIWELNKDVTQPDGRKLTNPDLIHPGWVMKMPSDASGPGLKVVEGAQPSGAAPATGSDSAATEASSTPASGAAEAAPATPLIRSEWQPFFGVAGGLALAGAFLGLRRHRASGSANARWAVANAGRPEPTDPNDPNPAPTTPGGRLTHETDTVGAAWIDRILRSAGTRLPSPARMSYDASGLAVSFDHAPSQAPPTGWYAPTPTTWVISRETDPDGDDDGPAPLPGLASLGRRDDGSILLLDLESRAGTVAIDGDPRTSRGLALSIAVDTATHPWADQRRVVIVGLDDDLAAVGQGAIHRSDSLGRVLESLENVARMQREACRRAGVETVHEARVVAPQEDWTYHLVVCFGSPESSEFSRAREFAADPKVAVGFVVVGADAEAKVRLQARADGRVVAPQLGIDVVGQQLDSNAIDALTDLFDTPIGGRRPSLDQLAEVLASEAQTESTTTSAVAELNILGSVQVYATGSVDPERKPLLTEMLSLLALHPQGLHANRLSAAMWPRGVDDSLRDSALQQLGTWLGTTHEGAPVLFEESGVWRLAPGAVRLDWDTFRASLNRAGADAMNRESHQRAALDLVRGTAFEGVESQRYGWLESLTLVSDVAFAVELIAQALAETAAERRDLAAADAALCKGLAVLPANEELWRSRLSVVASQGEDGDVPEMIDAMYAAIAEHGSPVGASADTDALVDELLPGYRTRIA